MSTLHLHVVALALIAIQTVGCGATISPVQPARTAPLQAVDHAPSARADEGSRLESEHARVKSLYPYNLPQYTGEVTSAHETAWGGR